MLTRQRIPMRVWDLRLMIPQQDFFTFDGSYFMSDLTSGLLGRIGVVASCDETMGVVEKI